MGNEPKVFELESGRKITSLDDLPEAAKLAERQRFLNRWYRPVALAPFVLAVILGVIVFPNSRSPLLLIYTFASLIWATFVAGYAFYLLTSLHCPYCSSRFGLGDQCRACGLPRHHPQPNTMFDSSS
jgi:hypothetical protein